LGIGLITFLHKGKYPFLHSYEIVLKIWLQTFLQKEQDLFGTGSRMWVGKEILHLKVWEKCAQAKNN
jgi:hypothetical protein